MNPTDTAGLDGAVDALYASLCGPAGRTRDWDRFRALFAPGAILTQCQPDGPPRSYTLESYIAGEGPGMDRDGFFERDVGRITEQFGRVAQVFSTYETRRALDVPPYTRGLNALQLYQESGRWQFLSVLWDAETAESPIPPRYLNKL